MKRLFMCVACLAVLLAGCGDPFGTVANAPVSGVPAADAGQLIVSLENDIAEAPEASVTARARSTESGGQFRIVNALTDGALSRSAVSADPDFTARVVARMGHVYTYEYSKKDFPDQAEAVRALKAVLEAEGLAVRYVEPNDTLYATTMHPSQEWHYEMIHAPEAWTVEGGSSSTIVAVLDTGIDYTHDAL